MPKEILLQNRKISYIIRRSHRARHLRIAVYSSGEVVVTVPFWRIDLSPETYLQKKAKWVLNKLDQFRKIKTLNPLAGEIVLPHRSVRDFKQNKEKASWLVENLVEKINETYQFEYRRISIKNQKTRWGSCSKKGNLNFNYRIVFLPDRLARYLVVHELCHLKELNHSRKFWGLVGAFLPNYKLLRKELKGKF